MGSGLNSRAPGSWFKTLGLGFWFRTQRRAWPRQQPRAGGLGHGPVEQVPLKVARPEVQEPAQLKVVPKGKYGFPCVPPTAVFNGSEEGKSAFAVATPFVA